MKFKDFDWQKIASLLGGSLRRSTATEAEIAAGRNRYRLQDLKGELIISRITPLAPHVGYDDDREGDVTEQTLAYRILCVVGDEPIDYTLHLGPAAEEDDEEDDDAES